MLDENYWEQRYLEGNTPWDLGGPAPALTKYLENVDSEARILIPGAGRAHEALWLLNKGFTNVSVLDLSAKAIADAKELIADPENINWIHADFFKHRGEYDYIVEQTFFCALDPALRESYAKQVKGLLKDGGILFGLLFNFPLSESGPPFGGSKVEYQALFEKSFEIAHLENCYNSIKPRAGREFFIELIA